MNYEPCICFLMITWSHGPVTSSSSRAKCNEHFFIFRAMHACHLIGNKPKNSCLLVASHKKSAIFQAIANLRIPFPLDLFSLVDSLMLLGMYMSHTISTHVQLSSCFDMCGRKILSAYSSNVETLTVGSKYSSQ